MNYYALLSVSDKTGIVDFAEGLIRSGYTIISSGGTHAVLQAGLLPINAVCGQVTSTQELFITSVSWRFIDYLCLVWKDIDYLWLILNHP